MKTSLLIYYIFGLLILAICLVSGLLVSCDPVHAITVWSLGALLLLPFLCLAILTNRF